MQYIVEIVFGVSQGMLAVISLLTICCKPFRLWIFNSKSRKKADEQRDNDRDEATRCVLRNIITQFYFTHKNSCELHQYEYENIAKAHSAYKALGGNSFVDRIWEEIQLWVITP